VGRLSSPLLITTTITTTIISIINTRKKEPHSSPSSLPYRRSNARGEKSCYQIFPPTLHSTHRREERKNLAPLRRPQERLCRSTDRQAASKQGAHRYKHALARPWCKLKKALGSNFAAAIFLTPTSADPSFSSATRTDTDSSM
jgi:hypothetical protein